MTDAPEKTVEQAEAELDQASILRELLASVNSLKEEQNRQKAVFEQEKAELTAKLEAATTVNAGDPALHPNAAPPGMIDPRTDHPETNIEAKLDCMEAVAELNNIAFDRERQRRGLLGIKGEDDNLFVYNAHAFETQEQLDAYKERVEREKDRTTGKYPRS